MLIVYCEIKLQDVPNGYNVKRFYLESQLKDIQVLVFGSSETLWAVDPSYFDLKGFNLADVSQSLFYDYKLLEKYADQMPSLKFAFITISYFSMGYQIHNSIEQWRDYFYYHFWDINSDYIKCFNLNKYSFITSYSVPITRDYLFMGFDVKLDDTIFTNGWSVIDSSHYSLYKQPINDSYGKIRVEYHNSLISEKNYLENINILDTMLHILRTRKVEPIIITIPVYKTYYKYIDTNITRRNNDIISAMCNKYKCKYYNFLTDPRFSVDDFLDNDHLNSQGAKKFSKIINECINSYITK